jgi:hypothetical protein
MAKSLGSLGIGNSGGYSASFDGTTDSIGITTPAPFQNNTCSVGFWMYPTNIGVPRTIYSTNYTGSAGFEVRIGTSSNILVLKQGVTTIMNNGAKTFALNTWHHVVVTYNSVSGLCTLYKNGASFDTATSAQTFTHGDVVIGRKTGDFQGQLDRLVVTSAEMTSGQAAALYQNNTLPSNTVDCFMFDEGSGTATVGGYAGSAATLTNATFSTNVPY